MADRLVIDLLERHGKVPSREDLLNEYVARFAGQRLGAAIEARPKAAPEPEAVTGGSGHEARMPAEAAAVARVVPDAARFDAVEGVAPEGREEPTAAWPAWSAEAAPGPVVEPTPEPAPVPAEAAPEPAAEEAVEPAPEPTQAMPAWEPEPSRLAEADERPAGTEYRSETLAFEAVVQPASEPTPGPAPEAEYRGETVAFEAIREPTEAAAETGAPAEGAPESGGNGDTEDAKKKKKKRRHR